MKIQMKKFGELLISRPQGKDAFAQTKAYIITGKEKKIILDFKGIKVLTPSWADEFITKLHEIFADKLAFININNSSVKASLNLLKKYSFR